MNLIQVGAPFNEEQIEIINQYQKRGTFHSLNCCGGHSGEQKGCERVEGKSEGVLVAKKHGLVCPCGMYTQTWAYNFMTVKKK